MAEVNSAGSVGVSTGKLAFKYGVESPVFTPFVHPSHSILGVSRNAKKV